MVIESSVGLRWDQIAGVALLAGAASLATICGFESTRTSDTSHKSVVEVARYHPGIDLTNSNQQMQDIKRLTSQTKSEADRAIFTGALAAACSLGGLAALNSRRLTS